MTHDQEREDLDALVKSPGWHRVKAWAKHDLAQNMTQATEAAADLTDDVVALGRLRQVIAAKKAVEMALNWPEERLAKLVSDAAGQEREPSYSRRGGL